MDEFSRDMEAWGGVKVPDVLYDKYRFTNLGFFEKTGDEPVLIVRRCSDGFFIYFETPTAVVRLHCADKLDYNLFMRYASAAGRMWAAYKEVF